MSESMALLYAG